jgi:uncharacterized membrane protein YjjB (DUF3815 family)
MAFHGSLAYLVNFGLAQFNAADNLNNFVSSFAVSFSAGIFSRFTGHQDVGNTVAGMYALVPGAYLVTSLFSTDTLDTSFFVEIIQRSLIIGIGAWSGTILCSVSFNMILWRPEAIDADVSLLNTLCSLHSLERRWVSFRSSTGIIIGEAPRRQEMPCFSSSAWACLWTESTLDDGAICPIHKGF